MQFNVLEKGIVLVIVMLFLLIISLLAVSLLSTVLLETKMSCYYQNRIQAFYKAEDLLVQYEQQILSGVKIPNSEIIDDFSFCGVTFYRITACAIHNGVKSKLQSIFAKVENSSLCDLKHPIVQGRQSFLAFE